MADHIELRQRESKAEIVARLGAPEAPYRDLRDAVRQADGRWELGLLGIHQQGRSPSL